VSSERHDCARTRGLIDRLVVGSASDDDRRHASTCLSCGPVMVRAERFEHQLESSSRQLIAEDLPRGILDPSLAELKVVPRMPGLAPGATAGFAALAVILFATVVGIRGIPPVLLPGTSSTEPPFAQEIEGPGESGLPDSRLWSLGELTVALAEILDYECVAAETLPTHGPGGEAVEASAICTAPPDAGPFTAAVTVDASESGNVVRVTITADIVGAPTQRARDAVATALAKVTAQAFIGTGPGIRAANFVFDKASRLSGPAWAMGIPEGDVWVDLRWLEEGGYIVRLSVAS
jgi:hypothetical protein